MRPTTSTTNNSKTSGKSQNFENLWVPLSAEIKIQFNNLTNFLWLVVSVVLPTQDIILNEIAARRVKFGFEILVLERKICYREGKWNWLIVILHHGYGWSSRIYVKLWQVGPYSYLRNFPELWETEGRRPADLLIGNGNTNLRDASYEITKPNPLLIEKSHVADTKEGSVIYLRLRSRWPETEIRIYDTLQLKLLEGRYANF